MLLFLQVGFLNFCIKKEHFKRDKIFPTDSCFMKLHSSKFTKSTEREEFYLLSLSLATESHKVRENCQHLFVLTKRR